MKKLFVIIILLSFLTPIFAQNDAESNYFKEVKVSVKNPLNINQTDAFVSVNIDSIKEIDEKFNKDAFIVYNNDKEIPSQLYNDGFNCSIIFVYNFKPNETTTFSIKYLYGDKIIKNYKPRTHAELNMKFDAVYKYDPGDKRNKFTSNHFESFKKVVVPKIHTDHDALFKFEGPGWESEKVGYRFYLDWRNTSDIFGKKVLGLVLDRVGTHDVTAHEDSYHSMLDWGMDIFAVGNTLGIGSIAMMTKENKIERVAKTEENTCEISYDGPILSEVITNYKGWQVDNQKFDLISKLSIAAGSRITNADLTIYDNAENITTGLVKHDNTKFMNSISKDDWQYIALYGKQSLSSENDNLGIVLFYKKSQLIKQGEDSVNYYVELKPSKGEVEYKYGAAWDKEPDGIKNEAEFVNYVNEELLKLNNPLKIEIK